MSLFKSVPFLCVSYACIGTNRCYAFVRLDPVTVLHMPDNHDSRESFLDDRIRLHGVESLHYRTFDDDQTNTSSRPQNGFTLKHKGQSPKSKTVVSSFEVFPSKDEKEKSQELNKYLDSINRRYKRLYDESGEDLFNPAITSSLPGFTTVWDWLMTSDSSRAVNERRKQDAMYILHHTAVTSELYLNPLNDEHDAQTVPKNKSVLHGSALIEASIIAGGSKILKTMETINTTFARISGIRNISRLFSSTIAVVRCITESTHKFISKIRNSTVQVMPMIFITYAVLLLTR